jgi:hypothetical protein
LWHVLALALTLSLRVHTQPDEPPSSSTSAVRHESLEDDSGTAFPLQFVFDSPWHDQIRVVEITKRALEVYREWHGGYPGASLTIHVKDAWSSGPLARADGVVDVRLRRFTPAADMSVERAVITGLARVYVPWTNASDADNREFAAGLTQYLAARAINQLLEGRHTASVRLFNGFVPYVIRWVPLSRARRDPRPMIRAYDEFDMRSGARAASMLHTLERLVGWPAVQQALAALHTAPVNEAPLPAFTQIISDQRGQDLAWLFEAVTMPDRRFDYALGGVTTKPRAGNTGFDTEVRLRRLASPFRNVEHLAAVVTRFGDGSEVRDRWPGTDEAATFRYTSRAPASFAAFDPEQVFVLDDDRTNSTWRAEGVSSPMVMRYGLYWMSWLQNLALTCSALL